MSNRANDRTELHGESRQHSSQALFHGVDFFRRLCHEGLVGIDDHVVWEDSRLSHVVNVSCSDLGVQMNWASVAVRGSPGVSGGAAASEEAGSPEPVVLAVLSTVASLPLLCHGARPPGQGALPLRSTAGFRLIELSLLCFCGRLCHSQVGE